MRENATSIVSSIDDWALWLAAVVGGLVALGWLAKHSRSAFVQVRRIIRRLDVLGDIVETELANNGGKTTKDKVDRTAAAVDALAEVADGITETVESVAEKVERIEFVETKLDGHLQWSQTETERRVAEEQRLWTAIEGLRPQPDDN